MVAEGAAKGEEIAKKITELTGSETKADILGHIQRGGNPTAWDRILATRLGAAAVDLILKNEFGKVVVAKDGMINAVDLRLAVGKKRIEADSYYQLIRDLI